MSVIKIKDKISTNGETWTEDKKQKTKIWEEITCSHCKGKFLIQSCEGDPICPYCGKLIKKWAGEVWA